MFKYSLCTLYNVPHAHGVSVILRINAPVGGIAGSIWNGYGAVLYGAKYV